MRLELPTTGVRVVSALFWLRMALPSDSAEVGPDRLPVLTRAEQVRKLAPADARLGYPIRLVGVVTYSDPGKGLLFVHDGGESVFVSPQAQVWDWPVGQNVEMTGVAAQGSHLPYVSQAQLQDLGPGTLPTARPVTLARLASNAEDGSWVEIRGVVRTATVRNGRPVLEIAGEGKRLRALFKDRLASRDDLGALVDAEVRLQGVGGLADKDPDSLVFVDIHVPGLANVVVDVKAPPQAIQTPARPIASLLAPPPAPAFVHRLRVKGALNRTPAGTWRISDATGVIRVHSTQPLMDSTNALVDVLGFAGGLPTAPVLEDATVFLPARPQDASQPLPAASERLLPVLTQAEVVRALPVSEAQRGYPVRIQGVVTYADPAWDLVYIQDETSGILVADPAHGFAGQAGQAVAVEGYSGLGHYAPVVREPRFHLLGQDRLPMAKPVTLEQLMTGQEDSQRVEIQGIVRFLTMERGHLALTLSASGGPVKAFIPDFGTNRIPTHLVDAEVQARGVCDTVVSKEGQWAGFRLLATRLADILVTKAAPADPFALPVQPINQLFQFRSLSDLRHRIHVRGSVTFRDPRWFTLLVQDERDSLYVRTLTAPNLDLGDRVEVVGFVNLEAHGPVMTEALVQRLGSGVPPPPTAVTVDQAISGQYQSRLITLDARLVDRIPGSDGRGLRLQAAEWSFSALLESTQSAQRLDPIREGSQLRLTGICRLEGGDSQAGKALRLHLRTPDDVVVLRRPPRLTPRQWMAVAGLASLLLAAAVSWVILLRRNVREQTRALRTLSESNQALIHATDEVALLNRVCRLVTGIGGYRLAWVGFAEQDEAKTVRPVAQDGFEQGYLETLQITWADTERGRGPTGTAIRTGEPCRAHDILTDPNFALWRPEALKRGYASSLALPLQADGRVFGALNIYSTRPDAFDPEELKLLTELADDLAFGLTALRVRAQQRQAEAALRESEERLRLLGDNLPDSYVYQYRLKADGTPQFLYLSAGVERLHGVRGEDALRDASLLLRQMTPELVPVYQAAEATSLKNLTDFTMALRLRRADGQWRWMQLCSRPRHTPDGKVLWDGVVTDITVRKEAEEAIRQSEERFRLIMENLTDLVAVLDLEGHRLYNSPSYRSILGDPDRLRGSCSFEEIHPDDRERVQASFRETVCTGAGQRLEYRLVDDAGTVRHIESQGSVIRDEQGGVSKVLVVSRDVTERQQAEAARRESERKYRELVEHANSIILRWTRDGRILFLNEFGQRFFGYTEAEICGRHVIGTLVPETESGGRDLPSLMDELCANPAAFEQNVNENMRRNGERVWIAWTNKIMLDPQGQVAGILSIGVDITARKRMEEELRATQATLEERVLVRTTELAEARDRAEAADRLKSAFLATMSHELRTPLNSIIGFTGILLQGLAGPLNAEQTRQLEMVRTSGRHLLALINDVLDISKIEAGELQVACEPFDVSASIAKVVGLVLPLAQKKGLALHAHLAPELDRIVSDPRRVEQILLNLLNNAIKFTERGEVTLRAELVPDATRAASTALRIAIADTGIGIKPEDLAMLFHPFRQIDTGLARNHEGTGLGLAICRRLADLLGGEIRAESEWQQGSVFTVMLPVRPVPEANRTEWIRSARGLP